MFTSSELLPIGLWSYYIKMRCSIGGWVIIPSFFKCSYFFQFRSTISNSKLHHQVSLQH